MSLCGDSVHRCIKTIFSQELKSRWIKGIVDIRPKDFMPSTQKFRDYVVAQFNGELRVTTRKMMGEYILYADGKIFGGIYDDRLLVKPVPAALKLLPGAKKQLPYEGAKPMLRITAEQMEDSAFLAELLDAMLPEVPAPKKK